MTSPSSRSQHLKMEDDQPGWSGKLIWSCGGSEVYATVQATNSIRDPGTSNWPTTLRLGIVEAGMSTLDIQAWAQKHKTPVARVECPPGPGMDSHHFDELVEILRKGRCVAVAQYEIEVQGKGSLKSVPVLAPLNKDLLCTIIPVSDLPKMQQSQAQQNEQHASIDAQYGWFGPYSLE